MAYHKGGLDLFSSQAGAGSTAGEVMHGAATARGGRTEGSNHALFGFVYTLSRQVQLAPVGSDHLTLVLCHLALRSCTQHSCAHALSTHALMHSALSTQGGEENEGMCILLILLAAGMTCCFPQP